MERLKIEYIPIKELTAYVGNAKEHTREQIDQIKESKVSSVIYSYTEKYPVTQVEGNMKYVKAN